MDNSKPFHPTSTNDGELKCPIDHTKTSRDTWLNLGQVEQNKSLCEKPQATKRQAGDKTPIDSETHCPVSASKSESEIDPRNLMPKDANFNRATRSQRIPLDNRREISTIPKTDDPNESHWVYPSQQMFYNAMKRKNWSPSEEDMKVIVPIHNAVNERAWAMILKYEDMYKKTCGNPKLVKFQGRPQDITLKARLKSWFGYTLPFDRHDWTVDRCGTEVRYIIDFYTGRPSPLQPELPSFYLDVRPDLSPRGLLDRAQYFFNQFI